MSWDKSLTVIASKLRNLLADHGIDGANALTGASAAIGSTLPEGTWVDVIAAATAAQEAEEALAAGDLDEAKTAAALAASLVRQPFLPGEEGMWVGEAAGPPTSVAGRSARWPMRTCVQVMRRRRRSGRNNRSHSSRFARRDTGF